MTFLAGLALGCIVTALLAGALLPTRAHDEIRRLRRRLAQTEAARDEWRERALRIPRKDVS
jgi:hypothetical protein